MADLKDHGQKTGDAQLNIEVSGEVAEGTYSNLVMITHSAEEFIFDFIRVMPGVPKARVKSRIIVSPSHAKRLLNALKDNVDKYEHAFGPIGERQSDSPVIQFQIPGGEA